MIELHRTIIRGAEIHYQDVGQGEPVVFVHGSLGDYRSWSLQVDAFAQRYRVVALSRRSHWPNVWPQRGEEYSAAIHADDLAAFLDHLGVPGPHVVSASYGSYCALILAERYPDRLRSLVVAEPPMLGWLQTLPGGADLVRPFIDNALIPSRDAFLRGDEEGGIRLFIDGVVGRSGAFESFRPAVRRMLLDNAREMRAESLSDRLFPSFSCEDAARIAVPTLLLTGERSPAFFHRISDELARCLPNHEAIQIPGVSHNLNSARPRDYNRIVLDFLGRVSQSYRN